MAAADALGMAPSSNDGPAIAEQIAELAVALKRASDQSAASAVAAAAQALNVTRVGGWPALLAAWQTVAGPGREGCEAGRCCEHLLAMADACLPEPRWRSSDAITSVIELISLLLLEGRQEPNRATAAAVRVSESICGQTSLIARLCLLWCGDEGDERAEGAGGQNSGVRDFAETVLSLALAPASPLSYGPLGADLASAAAGILTRELRESGPGRPVCRLKERLLVRATVLALTRVEAGAVAAAAVGAGAMVVAAEEALASPRSSTRRQLALRALSIGGRAAPRESLSSIGPGRIVALLALDSDVPDTAGPECVSAVETALSAAVRAWAEEIAGRLVGQRPDRAQASAPSAVACLLSLADGRSKSMAAAVPEKPRAWALDALRILAKMPAARPELVEAGALAFLVRTTPISVYAAMLAPRARRKLSGLLGSGSGSGGAQRPRSSPPAGWEAELLASSPPPRGQIQAPRLAVPESKAGTDLPQPSARAEHKRRATRRRSPPNLDELRHTLTYADADTLPAARLVVSVGLVAEVCRLASEGECAPQASVASALGELALESLRSLLCASSAAAQAMATIVRASPRRQPSAAEPLACIRAALALLAVEVPLPPRGSQLPSERATSSSHLRVLYPGERRCRARSERERRASRKASARPGVPHLAVHPALPLPARPGTLRHVPPLCVTPHFLPDHC